MQPTEHWTSCRLDRTTATVWQESLFALCPDNPAVVRPGNKTIKISPIVRNLQGRLLLQIIFKQPQSIKKGYTLKRAGSSL